MAEALEVEISAFLNKYNETFATYDGDQIAKLYCVPSITMRGDGSIHCFQSRDEIARFFQGVVDTYRREGAVGGTPHDVVAVSRRTQCSRNKTFDRMEASQGSGASRTTSSASPKAGASLLRHFT